MLRISNVMQSFLKRIITGDEKWIVYNNVNRKRSKDQRKEHDPPTQTLSKAITSRFSGIEFPRTGKLT